MKKIIKINILAKGSKFNWGYNFGYWYMFIFFKKELLDLGYNVNFYNKLNHDFFDCDYMFVSNKFFSENIIFKLTNKFQILKNIHSKSIDYKTIAQKIFEKNKNLIWFDHSDSAGTTQFEVLPYVKRYVKGQLYKNKELYRQNFFRNRYFSDYYQKKFNLEKNINFNFCKLDTNNEDKVILGWNLGIGNFFDIINHSNYKKIICLSQMFFARDKKKFFDYTLKNNKITNKKFDVFFRLNERKNNDKKSIHFQRQHVGSLLKKKYNLEVFKKKMNHKNYLINLMKSKVSVGCFGWGEICYREFEATKMGTAFIYPNIDYIETWPNIFIDGITYKSYQMDFSNLHESIEYMIENKNVRSEMIYNAQSILNKIYSMEGFGYLTKFLNSLK